MKEEEEELDEDEEEVDPPAPGPPDIPSGPLGVSIKSRQRGEVLLRAVGACQGGLEDKQGRRGLKQVFERTVLELSMTHFDIMFFFVCGSAGMCVRARKQVSVRILVLCVQNYFCAW